MRGIGRCAWLLGLGILTSAVCPLQPAPAGADDLPTRLRDRGPGVPTSMFGTYVQRGELLVYPFFEYYLDDNREYKPSELGYGLEQDFRAKYRASEGILFVSYGVSSRVSVEMEAAFIKARQERDPNDPSSVPAVIEESGSGDVEGQIRARLLDETDRRPEIWSYFEAVTPQQKDKLLIGTPDWEFSLGAGVTRGTLWGTVTARLAGTYTVEDKSFAVGEYAIDYLRSVSSRWRLFAGFEGEQDDVSLITEAQWHFSRAAYLKLNNSFGVTSKATDWAPEVGILFSFLGQR